MQLARDRFLSDEYPFIVRETDLRILSNHPYRLYGGAILFCTAGRATLSLDTETYELRPEAEAIVFPDTVVRILDASEGFRSLFFYFTPEMFEDAHRQFDPSFFHHLISCPVYYHTPASAHTLRQLFSVLMSTYSDMGNRFRSAIIANYLRNMLLNIYDKVQRNVLKNVPEGYKRKEELFHRFIDLILEHCTRHRDVEFYAGKLCISKRYLAAVTGETVGETPKATIDKHTMQEIKTLLAFSNMPLQQIADYLHFPDQSYLGRYFKRHTGRSPIDYRTSIRNGHPTAQPAAAASRNMGAEQTGQVK